MIGDTKRPRVVVFALGRTAEGGGDHISLTARSAEAYGPTVSLALTAAEAVTLAEQLKSAASRLPVLAMGELEAFEVMP
jgi:hypothetical protein